MKKRPTRSSPIAAAARPHAEPTAAMPLTWPSMLRCTTNPSAPVETVCSSRSPTPPILYISASWLPPAIADG